MSKTAALLKAGEEAKASLEEKLAIYAENLDYLQGKLESEGFKVSKGNKAVKDLRVEKNELNEKIKLKNDVIRNQVCSCNRQDFVYSSFLPPLDFPSS